MPSLEKHPVERYVNDSGRLSVIDYADLPFQPVRQFWIEHVSPDGVRGQHAHRKCWQAFFLNGSGTCAFKAHFGPDEFQEGHLSLETPLYIAAPLTWLELKDFSPEACLTVLCSHAYDPNDYIYDFQELKALWG